MSASPGREALCLRMATNTAISGSVGRLARGELHDVLPRDDGWTLRQRANSSVVSTPPSSVGQSLSRRLKLAIRRVVFRETAELSLPRPCHFEPEQDERRSGLSPR
ncbi:hypothetical protein CSOJ01_13326 [Colletotrichum sojae]|uniref:Uncharacterized protein n=1 Tax=Colletotrichum sojae TaxID=2175907 RepID=A0A8H6ISM3_9PEZI|nr:hypothetical protein CSOJ01_13326 [Colletotrichum sojae]